MVGWGFLYTRRQYIRGSAALPLPSLSHTPGRLLFPLVFRFKKKRDCNFLRLTLPWTRMPVKKPLLHRSLKKRRSRRIARFRIEGKKNFKGTELRSGLVRLLDRWLQRFCKKRRILGKECHVFVLRSAGGEGNLHSRSGTQRVSPMRKECSQPRSRRVLPI